MLEMSSKRSWHNYPVFVHFSCKDIFITTNTKIINKCWYEHTKQLKNHHPNSRIVHLVYLQQLKSTRKLPTEQTERRRERRSRLGATLLEWWRRRQHVYIDKSKIADGWYSRPHVGGNS